LLALASTVAALVIAEAAVRALAFAPGVKPIDVTTTTSVYRRSENPVLGYELRPNYRNDDPDSYVTFRRTNAHGQRDIERTLEKPPGVRRVLLLGDSVVEGEGIENLDETMSRQLEALHPDGRTEVLNFGVAGYCTLAEVELLETKGLAFDPDVVVIVFVTNDFRNFNQQLVMLGEPEERPRWVKSLIVRSDLFRLVSLRLDLFGLGRELEPMRWTEQAIGDNNVVEGLARLAALSRREGFEALVAIWPRFTDERILNPEAMPGSRGELLIERLARMNGLPTLRFSRAFRADRNASDPSARPRLLYSVGDRLHPNAHGHAIAARALRDAIAHLDADPERWRPEPVRRSDDGLAVEVARGLGGVEPDYAHARAYNNTAIKLEQLGRFDEAIESYRLAIEYRPDHADANSNLGTLLLARGEFEAAAAHLERALETEPNHAAAHINLARLLLERGELDGAIQHYRQALWINPNLEPAQAGLDESLRRVGLE